jgi:hypothetical protein
VTRRTSLRALGGCLLLGGCVTRVAIQAPLPDGRVASVNYFSTKAQKWILGVDPVTHMPTASINADTPTGWTGAEAGAFAQGILTGAGAAIGTGIAAGAGKPPGVPVPVVPKPAPPPTVPQFPKTGFLHLHQHRLKASEL